MRGSSVPFLSVVGGYNCDMQSACESAVISRRLVHCLFGLARSLVTTERVTGKTSEECPNKRAGLGDREGSSSRSCGATPPTTYYTFVYRWASDHLMYRGGKRPQEFNPTTDFRNGASEGWWSSRWGMK